MRTRALSLSLSVLALSAFVPFAALAAAPQYATVNLCNQYPYVVSAGGVNLNAAVRNSGFCASAPSAPYTLDLCGQSPRLYGFGGFDFNAFMQNSGQCG